MPAGVHDDRARREHRFGILKQQRSRLAARDQPRRGCVQDGRRVCDLRRKRRNSCLSRRLLSSIERRARRLRPQPPNRDAGDHQFVHGPQRGREGRGVDPHQRPLGLVEAPDQEQSPDREVTGVRGVDAYRRARRASPGPCRVSVWGSPDRARRARSPPRRPRTARERPPPSDRTPAPPAGGASSHASDRPAAPSRCLAAPAPAHRLLAQHA